MGGRRHIARFAAWALLPVLLLAEAVPGWTTWFCRHAEANIESPCCAGEDEAAAQDDGKAAPLAITEAACCTAIRSVHDRPTSEPSAPAIALPTVLVAALPALVVPLALPRPPTGAYVLPLSSGPPIRLKTQSFLN